MAGAALSPGAARGFNCPSCGSAVALRGLAWTRTVACASCGAVIDARDPNLRILQEARRRIAVEPLIPLGTRGEWHGAPHEVIGFQQRTILVDGAPYSWREYLLFNPYRGFRYLTEYDGHWNDVVPLQAMPVTTGGARPTATHAGVAYRHFQTARAQTTFVLGEFPWEVRSGDAAEVRDYVAPPRLLSAESTGDETTWSLGTYVAGEAVWRAFRLPGSPPPARGVYANQPSPAADDVRAYWRAFAALALLLTVVFLGRVATARRERAYEGRFAFRGAAAAAPRRPASGRAGAFDSATRGAAGGRGSAVGGSFATPSFDLAGRTSNVVVETEADVDDEWLFLDYALVSEATGRAYPMGREVSYYSGVDGGERWHEGSRRDRATLGAVPAGRYFLRVDPSGEARPGHTITYTVRVRRDVPALGYYLVAFLALVAPPVFGSLRAAGFETRRWAESDHAPGAGAGGDDDEEDDDA